MSVMILIVDTLPYFGFYRLPGCNQLSGSYLLMFYYLFVCLFKVQILIYINEADIDSCVSIYAYYVCMYVCRYVCNLFTECFVVTFFLSQQGCNQDVSSRP